MVDIFPSLSHKNYRSSAPVRVVIHFKSLILFYSGIKNGQATSVRESSLFQALSRTAKETLNPSTSQRFQVRARLLKQTVAERTTFCLFDNEFV